MTTRRWIIETWSHEVLEVTNMYNCNREETFATDEATSIVVRLPNGNFWATAVIAPVHPIQ